jgi:hypothetical protein
MGRKSILDSFIGKEAGGIFIIEKAGQDGDRVLTKCRCLKCERIFVTKFHNVYKGNYKSCGCAQFQVGQKSPRWKGYGEISKAFFFSIKRGAKSRNLSFEIDIQYIWNLFLQQDRKCFFSGKVLTFPKTREDTTGTASLDRIDANKGYIKGNLQWIEKETNYMKQQMNNEEFLQTIKLIYEYKFKK